MRQLGQRGFEGNDGELGDEEVQVDGLPVEVCNMFIQSLKRVRTELRTWSRLTKLQF